MPACSPGRQSSRGEGLSGVWASSKSVSSSRRTETPPALWQGRVTSTWSGSRHGGQRPQRGTGRQSQSRLPLTHLGRWTMGGPASKEHPVWHMTLKSGCPQWSLREANNLSSSVPMEGTPHPLPWGPCGLQEATLQRTGPAGSVSRRAVVWGGGRLTGQTPTDQPSRAGDSEVPSPEQDLHQPSPQGRWDSQGRAVPCIMKHIKFTAKPLHSNPRLLPASLPSRKHALHSSGRAPGSQLTPGTRSHVSRAGWPPRQSLIFKKRLTMYYS